MLAFDRYGKGEQAVVLLHGVGGGRSIWSDGVSGTASAIAAAGFTVIALDLPGYGDSPLPIAPLSIAGMADAALETVRALGLLPAVWLGHSMGGMVAQELAAREPNAVHGLVLACTSAAFGTADGAWQQSFLNERLAPLDAGAGMPTLAPQLVAGMVAPGTPPAVIGAAASVMARVPKATYRAALQALMGFDRRAALARIHVPTLLLAGSEDRNAPADVMQRMAQKIPSSTFTCLPGTGHLANVEQPAAFHATLVAFLKPRFTASR